MGLPDARIRSLETARQCVALGACRRTVCWVTGLNQHFIRWTIYGEMRPPRGRPPYSEEFIFHAGPALTTDLARFAGNYQRLKDHGLTPPQSLIGSYRHEYERAEGSPRFSFDQAFLVASSLDGIWVSRVATIAIAQCPHCRASYLIPLGQAPASVCYECSPVTGGRRRVGQREKASSKVPDQPEIEALDRLIARAKYERRLEMLGAHPRIVNLLSQIVAPFEWTYPTIRHRSYWESWRGRPISLQHWGRRVRPVLRIQYSLLVVTFRRLHFAGLSAEEAFEKAYLHARRGFREAEAITFDRAFEVLSQHTGLWGADGAGLTLDRCTQCGSLHLVSFEDTSDPSCPFCALARDPGALKTVQDTADV